MIIELPRKNSEGKILTVMVLCTSFEEANNYKLPFKYAWSYQLVDGILETFPPNRRYPYYRVIQRTLKKSLLH